MWIIGIDPGLTGAFAVIGKNGGKLIAVTDLPTMSRGKGVGKNQIDAGRLYKMLRRYSPKAHIFLELAQPMPKQGVSSTFIIGHTAGVIEGVIGCLGFPYTLVTPAKWKKECQLGKDKEQSRAAAKRLFPNADLDRKKDHNRAEAILLANWGRKQ